MIELISRIRRRAQSDAVAYRDGERVLTYADLVRRIDSIAASTAAVAPAGSVVLIRFPNDLNFAAAFLGVLSAGCDAFPISPESPPAEVESIIARSNAVAVVGDAPIDGLRSITAGDAGEHPPAASGGNLLLLSSGSTGRPKIVRRSAESLDAVSRQMVDGIGIQSDDRVLATVPLCHSYGLEHGLLAPLWAGAAVHLVRGLDLPRVMAELSGGITVLPGVPSMFELLQIGGGVPFDSRERVPSGQPLKGENSNRRTIPDRVPAGSIPRLRIAYSAGGPLPLSIAERFRESSGVPVGQIYGATEIGSITYSEADPATVGRPLAGVELKFDDGRVLVKADSMFDGYLDDSSPLVDGFYPTGDLGHLDSLGRLVVTGRSTLLIDVGGLKVNPIEVEAVLSAHPAVADSVVIPVRQSETVVRLKAILTPRNPDHPPQVEDVRRFARERLAGYKVPREIEIRPSLPRTETGKVLRQQVQA